MQIIVNEENNGSPFLQWLKGLSLATGDLVWIAEADDSCQPEFLERLVPEFYDPAVELAYCQSALIDSRSQRLADTFLAHTDDISTTRWHHRYTAMADDEAELALSQRTPCRTPARCSSSAGPARLRRGVVPLSIRRRLALLRLAIRSGKIAYLPTC